MVITKARQQEILQHKINILTQKLTKFIAYGISNSKYNKLELRKNNFIAAKVIVDAF